MGLNAFTKTGNTVTLTAATSAPAAVQCVSSTLGGNQYRIINAGTGEPPKYYQWDEATTNCVEFA